MRVLQQLVRAYLREQLQGVIYPVCSRIFFEVLYKKISTAQWEDSHRAYLIERADRSHEDDGSSVLNTPVK